jgi:hypothetical protein
MPNRSWCITTREWKYSSSSDAPVLHGAQLGTVMSVGRALANRFLVGT